VFIKRVSHKTALACQPRRPFHHLHGPRSWTPSRKSTSASAPPIATAPVSPAPAARAAAEFTVTFRPASPGNRGSRHSTLPPVDYRAVGSHLMEWLGRAELVWREFAVIPAAAIAAAIILSLEVVRLQRKINSLITQIGETP